MMGQIKFGIGIRIFLKTYFMYKVEAILDKKMDIKKNKICYLIKWEGYDVSQSTWEPIQNLQDNCLECLKAFDLQNQHLSVSPNGLIQNPSLSSPFSHPNPYKIKMKKNKKIQKENINLSKKASMVSLGQKKRKIKIQNIPKLYRTISDQKVKLEKNPKRSLQKLQRSHSSPSKITKKKSELHANQNKNIESQSQKKKLLRLFPTVQGQIANKNNFSATIQASPLQKNSQHKVHGKQGNKYQARTQNVIQIIKPQTFSPEKTRKKLKILGMRKNERQWKFYTDEGGVKGWKSHDFIIEKYPRELCLFYEENIKMQQ